jgi:hypothetical protein
MASEPYAQSRDRGLAVRRYEFRYGPDRNDYFAYTDSPVSVPATSGGRHRVYFSLDRSVAMAQRNRFDHAKAAVIYALEKMRDDVQANGTTYDVVVSQFSSTEGHIVRFDAGVSGINDCISWTEGLSTTTAIANYAQAVGHARSWFADAGDAAAFRNWIFLSSGECDESRLPWALELVAPLVNHKGSEEVGFISTDIYPLVVGSRDSRNLRFLHNTPHFPIDAIESGLSTQAWRRVSAVQRAAFAYESLAISMDDIKTNGSPEEKNEIKITVPKSCGLAEYYRTKRVQRPMQLTVFEGQADDPEQEFKPIWTGRVMSAKRKVMGNTVELLARPMSSAFKRTGLRRNYQYGCPHTLYGSQCGASANAATTNFQPTLANWDRAGKVLAIPNDLLGPNPGRYAGGTVHWTHNGNTTYRNIIEAKAGALLLDGPVGEAHASGRIYVTLGCAHTAAFCRNHHVSAKTGQPNIVNYGGCDKIPTTNPFRTTSNFY